MKRFLNDAISLVAFFARRAFTNTALAEDLDAMRAELEWMAAFDFLRDVGELTIVPLQSSVMQRRDGYRHFLRHHIQLGLASTISKTRDVWDRLLDLKDGALLYEVWSFFEVKRVLDEILHEDGAGEITQTTDVHRTVPWSVHVRYRSIDLRYNESLDQGSGSYSVTFRPDILVTKRGGDSLVLDAKLKFDGARLRADSRTDPDEWERGATRTDLYKMHTYRDALHDVAGAFVLYPGTEFVSYLKDERVPYGGIGAVPLIPAGKSDELRTLLQKFAT